MSKFLYAKLQLDLLALSCTVIQAEKEGWDKDPAWVRRGKNGQFGGGGSKSPAETVTDAVSDAADSVKKGAADAEESVEEAVQAIKTKFDKAAKSVKGDLDDLMKSARDLTDEEKQRISDTISSPSGKKVRDKMGSVLKEVSPEAAKVFDDATGEIEDAFDDKSLEDAIDSSLEIAGKSAQKVGEVALKAGKMIAPAALVLGGLAAVAATGGAAGVLAVGGVAIAAKNFTIPNAQGKGGKQAAEAFLTDPKNRADWLGHAIEYLKGGVSNFSYNVGLGAAALGTGILLAEVEMGTLENDKKAFMEGLGDLVGDTNAKAGSSESK